MILPSIKSAPDATTDALRGVPLVRQMLNEPALRLLARAQDKEWVYERVIGHGPTGFNPYRGELYFASRSVFASWYANEEADLRELNEGDLLLPEVLFAVHDYLHAWSASLLSELLPHLKLGRGELRAEDMEDLAWCHLLTETVATVGLDYWFLCCEDLASFLDIGSSQSALTVSYDERHIEEYRRFRPDLEVQTPGFFIELADFYASGRFPGFDIAALRRSPRVLGWLRHELSYGAKQRQYTRQWLHHLAGLPCPDAETLAAPLSIDEPWKREILELVSQRLWEKVKEDRHVPITRRVDVEEAWKAPEDQPLDFRFTNANALGEGLWGEIEARGMAQDSFPFLADQLLMGAKFDPLAAEARDSLRLVKRAGCNFLLRKVVDGLEKVEPATSEPLDIFVIP